jgi:hypothetical protein
MTSCFQGSARIVMTSERRRQHLQSVVGRRCITRCLPGTPSIAIVFRYIVGLISRIPRVSRLYR